MTAGPSSRQDHAPPRGGEESGARAAVASSPGGVAKRVLAERDGGGERATVSSAPAPAGAALRAGDWVMDAGMTSALGLEAPEKSLVTRAGAPVQLRRVPTDIEAELGASERPRHDANSPAPPSLRNYAANAEGARRVIERAEAAMTPEERAMADEATLAGQSQEAFDALPERERLIRRIDAIARRVPRLALGDPAEREVGARRGTDDAAHIAAAVAAADRVLQAIASGAHDESLAQVFGVPHVATAKQKYARGAAALQRIHAAGQIVTDRSGTLAELGAGGLSRGSDTIMMEARYIDAPSDLGTVGLIHEAMHAGNDDISDRGYIESPMFTQLAEDVKLGNAAHYEVTPRRILGVEPTYAGVTFTPAAAPASSDASRQLAVREASEQLRAAWTMGLNLHVHYMNVYQQPTLWWARQSSGEYRDGMPYWSKVEKLTIHQKEIRPMSSDPALHPVSQIDLALSEGVTGRLSACHRLLRRAGDDEAEMSRLAGRASAGEHAAAAADPVSHRELWVKIALREGGPITGAEARDLRVIRELAELRDHFGAVWRRRDPGDFPD